MFISKLSSLNSGYITSICEAAASKGAIDLAASHAIEDLPVNLTDALNQMTDQELNTPSPLFGLPSLREQISQKTARLHGHVYNPQLEVTITTGINQSIFAAMNAFLDEGDEVILFEPAAEDYLPIILLSGAKPVYISLKEPNYYIDWNEVTRMINGNTRLIIINTPHNPTGMVLNELDMLRLQKIINSTRILILSDERYEHLVYDGHGHQSVAMYPKLAEKSILVNSLSTACRVSWPVSYCAAPAALMTQMRKILTLIDGNSLSIFQSGLSNCFINREYNKATTEYYRRKKEFFQELMTAKTRFSPLPVCGTWFQLYSYSAISAEPDKEFAMRILNETGVAAAPYSSFFHEKQKKQLLRFNFARPDAILEKAVEKLSQM